MDETYQIYVNRVARLTLPPTYQTLLQSIQKSPKFAEGKPVPFPGYSVITPPQTEDPDNASFYSNLTTSQQELLEALDDSFITPVPPESFHMTVADLIWDNGYRDAVAENETFEQQLRQCIRKSFQQYQQETTQDHLSQWQLLGLYILPRAIAVALVPQDELSYDKVVQLRRSIYQNSDLINLGIQQQYHFTAHVTLGYFNDIEANRDRDRLASILSQFNDGWLESHAQILSVRQAQLRKFEDMTQYKRNPDDPVVEI